MSRSIERTIEKAIVKKILTEAVKYGYEIVAYDSMYQDGDSPMKARKVTAELLDYIDGGDDAFISLRNPTKEGMKEGWVQLIYGNSGWDVVNDYSTGIEELMKPVNEFSDNIADGKFKIVA